MNLLVKHFFEIYRAKIQGTHHTSIAKPIADALMAKLEGILFMASPFFSGDKSDSPSPAAPISAAGQGNSPHPSAARGTETPSPVSAAGVRPTEINALLGRGTSFEGKLFFEGRVRVDGNFRGEIRGEDVLVIGEGARVSGSVHVGTCIVTGGDVEADIKARDAIELYAPSKVKGSLHSPAIFIDRGVVFDGSCKMAPLDEPSLPAAEMARRPEYRNAGDESPLDLPMLAPGDEDDVTRSF